ncbi:MAG: hypothetical protein FJ123_03545 [Deltaproteobacteria bacterium]|nr:hypothetical protein [Deltaproteobacteria bacterium]
MKRIVGVVVARMRSKRLPGKPMLDLAGKPSIERHIERLCMVNGISDIYIATSKARGNLPLFEQAERLGVKIYAGAEEDVVERFVSIGKASEADALVRIGCDKPLFCYELLQKNVASYQGEDYIYFKQGVTVGAAHEILSLNALREVHKNYLGTAIAQYMREHPHKFDIRPIEADTLYKRPEYRLALDTPEDYRLLKILFEALQAQVPIPTREALAYLDDNPQLALINRDVENKGVNIYSLALEKEPVFRVLTDANGAYWVVDRMGYRVSYQEFMRCVLDEKRWAKG